MHVSNGLMLDSQSVVIIVTSNDAGTQWAATVRKVPGVAGYVSEFRDTEARLSLATESWGK